jgi:hypothetical protein
MSLDDPPENLSCGGYSDMIGILALADFPDSELLENQSAILPLADFSGLTVLEKSECQYTIQTRCQTALQPHRGIFYSVFQTIMGMGGRPQFYQLSY